MAKLTVSAAAFVLKPPLSETHGAYELVRRRIPEANHAHLWEIKRGDEVLHVGNEAELRQILASYD